jgi:hypothetical protein
VKYFDTLISDLGSNKGSSASMSLYFHRLSSEGTLPISRSKTKLIASFWWLSRTEQSQHWFPRCQVEQVLRFEDSLDLTIDRIVT